MALYLVRLLDCAMISTHLAETRRCAWRMVVDTRLFTCSGFTVAIATPYSSYQVENVHPINMMLRPWALILRILGISFFFKSAQNSTHTSFWIQRKINEKETLLNVSVLRHSRVLEFTRVSWMDTRFFTLRYVSELDLDCNVYDHCTEPNKISPAKPETAFHIQKK